ncbi:MAG: ABC transporter ATP-binding protein/permease [Candidatus Peregrinibacteria bacterium]|nr:ABC transporter ATP-binding protein/permease [Candidatus Peregrinibacteria bacterium]
MKLLNELKEISQGFKKMLSFLERKEKTNLFISAILMIFAGILVNLPAVILGKFVDQIINLEEPTFAVAVPFLAIIIVFILLKETLTVVRKYLVENIATQTEKKLTVKTVGHLLKTDIGEFINKYQIGALHGKIFRSIQGLIKLIKLGFLDFFPTFFTAIAALGIAFYQKPILASFMILVIPAGLFIVIKQVSSQKGIRISLLRGKEKIDGKVVEMMSGLETIRVDNTTNFEVQKVESIAENLRKIEIKHHIHMMFYDAVKYLNEAFFYILVISISIYFAVNGVITKGDILTYSILFMSILTPLRTIHRILDESHESSIKVQDLDELLSQPLDKSFKISEKNINNESKLALEIKNLSFTYPQKSKTILKNINLEIKKGEKIGIAGTSGCGKSTLIKIILKLIHNYSGKIYFLGNPLCTISRKEISKKISYIPQKTYIFSGTIKENVIYGITKKTSDEAIINALKQANIYDETKSVLGGLSGKVSENGNNLSGGQKQRIALARLILKSPEILIFDEATSALDNTNEAIIQKNIENIFSDKTIITIAHRLTTLKNSDKIFVFNKGQIAQEGNFKNLSQKEGLFKEFLNQNTKSTK